ncbi:hypothetical protein ACQBAT_10235 [Ornithinimicrobium sp. Y1847]|uniref:hypothetical protein n=1 Tax=Ornithinimicrobium sp. Y1847 TaxID=3405419 RepID=UPI003B68595C
MSLSTPVRSTMTTLGALGLALSLSSCWVQTGSEVTEGPVVQTGLAPDEASGPDGAAATGDRLSGSDIRDDPEHYEALGEQMREEFTALSDGPASAALFHSLHLCSVLYADHDHDRDVQQRYGELLEGFSGDGFISTESGQHWVDFSIEQLCPDLEPVVTR